VHMSPFHFARMFKQATSHPPHTYITLLRIEHAKNLLGNGDLQLVEIAACVGYQTQAHFTGVFHKQVGTTPRAYRLRTLAQRDAR
jgi:AraC family transcriptional regulator